MRIFTSPQPDGVKRRPPHTFIMSKRFQSKTPTMTCSVTTVAKSKITTRTFLVSNRIAREQGLIPIIFFQLAFRARPIHNIAKLTVTQTELPDA